jgi:hypothetical protein
LRSAARPSRAWADGAAVGIAVLACAAASTAQAQFSGVVGIDSDNRYRGLGTDEPGPVLRLGATLDLPPGPYASLSALWRTHDGGLANADGMVGWSGRWSDIEPLRAVDAAWGWDVAAHRRQYGDNPDYDFNEAMIGLLGPHFNARVWWSPHYYGQAYPGWYLDLNAWHEIGEHLVVFAHVGRLAYGSTSYRPPYDEIRNAYTDALVGASIAWRGLEVRATRDGLIAGKAPMGYLEVMRQPGWVLSASYAF